MTPTPIVSAGAADSGPARTCPAKAAPVVPRKPLRFSSVIGSALGSLDLDRPGPPGGTAPAPAFRPGLDLAV